jgi:dTDP-4-amino-4,6-dideoxygalactose transaminase
MTLTRTPIIDVPYRWRDMLRAIKYVNDPSARGKFISVLRGRVHSENIYLTSSGIASFYIILMAMKKMSHKTEVLLPAYTAGSLVTAVLKAGLRPVLYDVCPEDFNPDEGSLFKVISDKTLAVLGVHLFGICIRDIERLRKRMPADTFLIEDCAQASGSMIGEKYVGSFGDAGFFSFNRGKNIPLGGGGCIVTDNEKLASEIEKILEGLKDETWFREALAFFKVIIVRLGTDPLIYGIGSPIISNFKDTTPSQDFPVGGISYFQSGLGAILAERAEGFFLKRYNNGMRLISALEDVKGLTVPRIPGNTRPAFNRFPILFETTKAREEAAEILWHNGIEASSMYSKPVHHMFDIGYKKEDFPNAGSIARRLLTLPVHPSVDGKILEKMAELIRNI